MPLETPCDKVSALKFNEGINWTRELKPTKLRFHRLLSIKVVIEKWINNHFATAEGEYEFVLPYQLM